FAEVDPALGRIMLEVGAVGAVVMPATLGASVAAALSGPHRCPIIAHPRSDRWTFLTGPTDNSYLDMSLFADLFRVCASIALPGSRIVLPSPADERTGYRSWVSAPEDDYRPDLTEVTTVTRAAAAAPRCGMNCTGQARAFAPGNQGVGTGAGVSVMLNRFSTFSVHWRSHSSMAAWSLPALFRQSTKSLPPMSTKKLQPTITN